MNFDAKFESQLAAHLQSGESSDQVAQFVLQETRDGNLTDDQVSQAAWFCFHANCESELKEITYTQLIRSKPVPWDPFLSWMAKQNPSEDTLTLLLEGIEIESKLEALTFSPLLHVNLARTRELKSDLEESLKEGLAAQRLEMLEQAQRFSVDRLFEEEMQTLLRLESMYPGDLDVASRLRAFAMRQARDVIASRKRRTFESELDDDIPKMRERREADALSLSIAKALVDAAAQEPQSAYDLAVSLLIMDFPNQAFEALKHAPNSAPQEWLKLEILLENRRFVEALEEARILESKYAQLPEATHSVMYSRARALWGLHRGEEAIDVLQRIVQIRPNYRSAHALLLAWKERGT